MAVLIIVLIIKLMTDNEDLKVLIIQFFLL